MHEARKAVLEVQVGWALGVRLQLAERRLLRADGGRLLALLAPPPNTIARVIPEITAAVQRTAAPVTTRFVRESQPWKRHMR